MNFIDLRTIVAKTSSWKFWEEEFKGVCDDIFIFWWFLFLYLRMDESLIESFLVFGPHYNNVIGGKNKICNIKSSYLHHIFNYHCDFGELFKSLSCWTLNNFLWNLVAFVTPGVITITNANSNNLILDWSKSTMVTPSVVAITNASSNNFILDQSKSTMILVNM